MFYCLQTIENNRKTIGTIDFDIFLAHPKITIILGILTKFGEIITTLAHFMADSFSYEIDCDYIGFTYFGGYPSLKLPYFPNGYSRDSKILQKYVK